MPDQRVPRSGERGPDHGTDPAGADDADAEASVAGHGRAPSRRRPARLRELGGRRGSEARPSARGHPVDAGARHPAQRCERSPDAARTAPPRDVLEQPQRRVAVDRGELRDTGPVTT